MKCPLLFLALVFFTLATFPTLSQTITVFDGGSRAVDLDWWVVSTNTFQANWTAVDWSTVALDDK